MRIRQAVLAVSPFAAVYGCFALGEPKLGLVYFAGTYVVAKGILGTVVDLCELGILLLQD